MTVLNDANKIYVGNNLASKVYLGTTQVWPKVQSSTLDVTDSKVISGEKEFDDITDKKSK